MPRCYERDLRVNSAAALALAAVLGLFGCELLDELSDFYVMDNQYESAEEARSADAVSAGAPVATYWLPGLIPDSATEIKERRVLDGSFLWVTFSFCASDYEAMVEPCLEVDQPVVRFPRDPNRFGGEEVIDWWPEDLQTGQSAYAFFRCYSDSDSEYGAVKRQTAWLAVDVTQGQAYYWHTR